MHRAFCLVAIVLSVIIILQSAITADEADNSLSSARKQMLIEKNYELAALGFIDFIEKNPDHQQVPVALAYMALCYSALNMHDEATDAYSRLLEDYPDASKELRQDAMSYGGDAAFKAERFEEAAALYTQLLQEFPDSAPAKQEALFERAECWSRLAQIEENQGKLDKQKLYLARARDDYLSFNQSNPGSDKAAPALFSALKAAFNLGDYDKSAELCRLFIKEQGGDKRKAEALSYLAESLFNLENYEASRKAYSELLSLKPEPTVLCKAYEGLAQCDDNLGDYLAAGNGFAEAARLSEEIPSKACALHLQAAQSYQKAQNFQQAKIEYLPVSMLENHPAQSHALLQLGVISSEESQDQNLTPEERTFKVNEAISYFEKVLEITDNTREDALNARLFLGEMLIEAKEFTRAAKILGEVAEFHPESSQAPWALYNQALSLDKSGEHLAAAKAIEKLSDNYPENPVRLQAVYASAAFYHFANQEEEAQAAYEWLANKSVSWAAEVRDEDGNPNAELVENAKQFASDALFRLAETFKTRGDFAKAVQNFRLFISQYPNHPEVGTAHLLLAGIAEAEDDLDKAEREYTLAILHMEDETQKIEANYRLAIINLARAQKETNEEKRIALLSGAQRNLEAFINTNKDDPRSTHAYYYLAEVKYTGGFKENALEDYNTVITKEPGGEYTDKALFGAAWCLHDLGKLDESCKNFQTLVDNFPESTHRPEALYLIGTLKKQSGDYAGSEAAFNAFLQQYPDHKRRTDTELEKGKLLVVMGKVDMAVEIFDTFLEQVSDHPYTESLLEELSWAWQSVLEARHKAVKEAEAALQEILQDKTFEALSDKMKATAEPLIATLESSRQLALEAETKIKGILEQLANDYPSSKFLGMIYMRLGEIEYRHDRYLHALDFYNKAYNAVKNNPESKILDKALYRIAWCYLHLAEDHEKTATTAEDLSNGKPVKSIAEEWNTMALKYFRTLVESHTKSEYWADASFRSAELQRKFEEYETAIQNYNQALARSPEAKFARAAYYGIQLCNLGLKQYNIALKNAMAYLDRYNKGDYVHEANWVIGESLLMLEDYNEAEKYYNAAISNRYAGKVAAKSQYGLGMIAMKQGRLEDARKAMYKVVGLHSQWPNWAAQALLEASRISIKLKQKDTAVSDLKRILKHYPKTPAAAKAKELLQSLTQDINLRRKNYFETKMIRV